MDISKSPHVWRVGPGAAEGRRGPMGDSGGHAPPSGHGHIFIQELVGGDRMIKWGKCLKTS